MSNNVTKDAMVNADTYASAVRDKISRQANYLIGIVVLIARGLSRGGRVKFMTFPVGINPTPLGSIDCIGVILQNPIMLSDGSAQATDLLVGDDAGVGDWLANGTRTPFLLCANTERIQVKIPAQVPAVTEAYVNAWIYQI